MRYGDTARSWPEIVAFYEKLARGKMAFRPLADLASRIAASPYIGSGLSGATSMHNLVLAPNRAVFDNPHLVVQFDFYKGEFELAYLDGGAKPWTKRVAVEDAFGAVEHFLTRQARWYKAKAATE